MMQYAGYDDHRYCELNKIKLFDYLMEAVWKLRL